MTQQDFLHPHSIHPGHPLAEGGFMPIDTETFPISREYRYPLPVIIQTHGTQNSSIVEFGIDERRAHIEDWLTKRLATTGPRAVTFVGVNIKYDMIVLAKEFTHLQAAIWDKYKAGQVMDLSTIHKVLNLFEFGEINVDPTGRSSPKADKDGYSEGMIDLLKFYYDEDRQKTDARYGFEKCYGLPVSQWLPGFEEYAREDAVDTWRILRAQLERIERLGATDTIKGVVPRRALMHYALGWMTEFGMRVDEEGADRIKAAVEESLDLKHFPLLVGRGIIEPPQPERARFTAKGEPVRSHLPECPRKGSCGCPQAITKAKPEKESRTKLRAHVLQESRRQGRALKLTDKGIDEYREINGEKARSLDSSDALFDSHPHWVCADKSVYTILGLTDPVLGEYTKRAETAILRSNYIERFYWDYVDEQPAKGAPPEHCGIAERVHFDFNDLVSTGRTSAFASKLYPSMQGQNPDPRVRGALVADPGNILLSTDYASLELCAVADKMESLGIQSRLAWLYQNGLDPHLDLGAGLLKQMGQPDEIPPALLAASTFMEEYEAFAALKKSDPKLYKFWRTFAKPTGLGSWGAMGATTMAIYSRSMDGLEWVKPEDCKAAIAVWRNRYPEKDQYFGHIRSFMRDEAYDTVDEDGEHKEKYWYRTFDGMVRRNCRWSVVSNNFGLQAPGAEGACRMVPQVVRECIDPTLGSPLLGSIPLSFLHDEMLMQIPIYDDYADTQRAIDRLEEIMVTTMQEVISRVPMKVESVAMYRWDKYAAEERTADGWLVPADEFPNYPEDAA